VSWFVLLDAVVAVLLAATIVYAILLNRKLGHLRGNRSEIEKTAAEFNLAIAKAEGSVAKLQVSTDGLRLQLDKAQSLKDDLTLLIERGDAVADALEEAVRVGRKQREAGPRSRPVATGLGAVPVRMASASMAPASLMPASTGLQTNGSESAPPRTEAERELLRALASGR
jgi:hypothetical protein